jgi:flagellar biosynthesis/type III secretory pathway protein FliH
LARAKEISLFERFAPEAGESRADSATAAVPFQVDDFGSVGPKTSGSHFEEFSPKTPGLSQVSPSQVSSSQLDASQMASSSADLAMGEKAGAPSLGYLFEPFDPGSPPLPRDFSALKTKAGAESFEFRDLEISDVNIVNTLDKAEKKARATIMAAEEKSEKLINTARAKAQEIADQIKLESESEAAAIKKAAEAEAQRIREESLSSFGEAESSKLELDKIKANLSALNEEAGKLKAEAREKLLALNESEAQIKAQEAELKKAREDLEAEKIETLAKAEKAGREEGYLKGLSLGEKEGRAKGEALGRAEALDRVQGLVKAIDKVERIWRDLWEANGAFMVQLAVDAVGAILFREIENGAGLAAGAFKACVGYLTMSKDATFRICPGDLAELELARAESREDMASLVNVKFIPDPALGPGDIVMESDVGRLDATVKTRREKVMGVLKEALAQGLMAPVPGGELTLDNLALNANEADKDAVKSEARAPGVWS